ncbi:MAG: TIGR03905 family TSCPD domain-containing protein [Selenomonadaceae bacterium]|nr:TIGR03905 family TSCPD domain-containing protein [Selenomonadaceae bacterium]MBR3721865.1 TIGR03905 family TSCPD domain-containing protein [Selenomonadaceae bacterium]
MASYTYTPQNVCAKQLSFDLEDGKLYNVFFMGGCPGNLTAIGKLLEGTDAKNAVALLKGNRCGSKPTSCADQLAIAVENALKG